MQRKYNEEHGIEPASIIKSVDSDLVKMANLDYMDVPMPGQRAKLGLDENEDIDKAITRLTKEMKEAAKNLDFERAAEIRDKIRELKEIRISFSSRKRSRISAAFSKSRFLAASFISFVRRVMVLSMSSPSCRPSLARWPGIGTSR